MAYRQRLEKVRKEKPLKTAVIIVAAGQGSRFGGPMPKQWLPLAGQTPVARCLAQFASALPGCRLVLVVAESGRAQAAAHPEALVVIGGAERAVSVRAGLEALAGSGIDRVLIHDAARPLVPLAVIRAVHAALDTGPAAAPGLPLTDALWRVTDGKVTEAPDRSGLWRAQTPQGFHFDAILAAHRGWTGAPAADDVAVARAAGLVVSVVPGDECNIKLTTPGDDRRALALLEQPMDIRTGNGFDVHRLGPGDHVWLCGVRIPHEAGLVGHSDADVGLHAACDAIYGALAEGDIGRHFPPSDPQWKGAASDIFLAHAGALAASRGYRITHVDVTLICERPKIGPHAAAMQARMTEILQLEAGRVSVKATTSEELGFTGRREGIAALATATLVSP